MGFHAGFRRRDLRAGGDVTERTRRTDDGTYPDIEEERAKNADRVLQPALGWIVEAREQGRREGVIATYLQAWGEAMRATEAYRIEWRGHCAGCNNLSPFEKDTFGKGLGYCVKAEGAHWIQHSKDKKCCYCKKPIRTDYYIVLTDALIAWAQAIQDRPFPQSAFRPGPYPKVGQ